MLSIGSSKCKFAVLSNSRKVFFCDNSTAKSMVLKLQVRNMGSPEILSVSKFLSKKNFDILYFADSLGCLKPKNVENIKMYNKLLREIKFSKNVKTINFI